MEGKSSFLLYWEMARKSTIQYSFSCKFARFAHLPI